MTSCDVWSVHRMQSHAEMPSIDTAQLCGVREVRITKAAAYLHFDDVDITIKVVAPPRAGAAVLETVWDVTARESGPGLGTWWGSWRRFLPAGQGQPERRVAEEIRDAVDRIRQMLDAHAQRVSHRGGGRA